VATATLLAILKISFSLKIWCPYDHRTAPLAVCHILVPWVILRDGTRTGGVAVFSWWVRSCLPALRSSPSHRGGRGAVVLV